MKVFAGRRSHHDNIHSVVFLSVFWSEMFRFSVRSYFADRCWLFIICLFVIGLMFNTACQVRQRRRAARRSVDAKL